MHFASTCMVETASSCNKVVAEFVIVCTGL